MSIRFQHRIRILPWLYLNFGKGGVSISIGPRGAKITLGKRGVKGSIGVPGTGIRYETPYYKAEGASDRSFAHEPVNVVTRDVNPKSNMDRLRDLKGTEAWRQE